MGLVVSVSSDEDVSAFILAVTMRPDSVWESWGHAWNKDVEGILETAGEGELFEFTGHDVIGNGVSVDAVSLFILFVVIDEEFLLSIAVEVNEGDRVGAEDCGIIDSALPYEGSVLGGDSVKCNLLVEELGGEDDNLIFVPCGLNFNFDADIGSLCDDMLLPCPTCSKTFSWVLEPNELTFSGLGVGASS